MVNQILIEEFGKRIRQLRTERNLSQEQLAELTGVGGDYSTLRNSEQFYYN